MKFFRFIESKYVSSNIELQTLGLKNDFSPWLDAHCKAASQMRNIQHTVLKFIAMPVIIFGWFLTVIRLKKDPQTAHEILSTHTAFALAQQAAAADAVKAQRLAQLQSGTGPQTLQGVLAGADAPITSSGPV